MLSWRYQGAATFRLVYFVHLAGFVKPEKMYRVSQVICQLSQPGYDQHDHHRRPRWEEREMLTDHLIKRLGPSVGGIATVFLRELSYYQGVETAVLDTCQHGSSIQRTRVYRKYRATLIAYNGNSSFQDLHRISTFPSNLWACQVIGNA